MGEPSPAEVLEKLVAEEVENIELRRYSNSGDYLPDAIFRRGFEKANAQLRDNSTAWLTAVVNAGKLNKTESELAGAAILAFVEAKQAAGKWPKFNSAHEGFAVLLEEVDELKAHVWLNQKKRDPEEVQKEGIQVAAMALRFVVDICNEEMIRK